MCRASQNIVGPHRVAAASCRKKEKHVGSIAQAIAGAFRACKIAKSARRDACGVRGGASVRCGDLRALIG